MNVPPRLAPLLGQFDWGCLRLVGPPSGRRAERLVGAGSGAVTAGSDTEDVFLAIVWWVNQEVPHHGAEIALLRDLSCYRTSG